MEVPAKFVKLMMLTSSENDGEALVALRKANAMLAEADVNWEEFLKLVGTSNVAVTQNTARTPSGSYGRTRPPWEDDDEFSDIGRDAKGRFTDADDINRLFEQAYRKCRPSSSFREFLDSVHMWWEANGFLTEKQYSAIKRSALR